MLNSFNPQDIRLEVRLPYREHIQKNWYNSRFEKMQKRTSIFKRTRLSQNKEEFLECPRYNRFDVRFEKQAPVKNHTEIRNTFISY